MYLRIYTSIVAFVLGGFFLPIIPYAGFCTFLVLADFASAMFLRRRLRRKGQQTLPFSSNGLGRSVKTLALILALLVVAHCADALGLQGLGIFSSLKSATSAIAVWQITSIAENLTSGSSASWAKFLRRFLMDKTDRHLPKEQNSNRLQ